MFSSQANMFLGLFTDSQLKDIKDTLTDQRKIKAMIIQVWDALNALDIYIPEEQIGKFIYTVGNGPLVTYDKNAAIKQICPIFQEDKTIRITRWNIEKTLMLPREKSKNDTIALITDIFKTYNIPVHIEQIQWFITSAVNDILSTWEWSYCNKTIPSHIVGTTTSVPQKIREHTIYTEVTGIEPVTSVDLSPVVDTSLEWMKDSQYEYFLVDSTGWEEITLSDGTRGKVNQERNITERETKYGKVQFFTQNAAIDAINKENKDNKKSWKDSINLLSNEEWMERFSKCNPEIKNIGTEYNDTEMYKKLKIQLCGYIHGELGSIRRFESKGYVWTLSKLNDKSSYHIAVDKEIVQTPRTVVGKIMYQVIVTKKSA